MQRQAVARWAEASAGRHLAAGAAMVRLQACPPRWDALQQLLHLRHSCPLAVEGPRRARRGTSGMQAVKGSNGS